MPVSNSDVVSYLMNTSGWLVQTAAYGFASGLQIYNDNLSETYRYIISLGNKVSASMLLTTVDKRTCVPVSEPVEIIELSQIPGYLKDTLVQVNTPSIDELIGDFLIPENYENGVEESGY